MPRSRIFISYRRSDSAGHAGRLEADLTRRLGSRVFMDVSDIAAGDDFVRVLDRELASCGVVIAMVGARWTESFQTPREGQDFVRLELRQALGHDDVTVIPVLVQGAQLPAATDLPADLGSLVRRQAVVLRDDRWDDDVAHLTRSMRQALGLSRVPRWLAPTAVGVLAAIALGSWLLRPTPPAAFDRDRATDIAIAAVRKAAARCADESGVRGECPVLFEFPASGRATQVYYPVGYCDFKGSPFGDCLLEKLAETEIPPFNDVETVEVELGVRLDAGGQVQVTP
ncbi:MAG: toll/interleukin-1 receptor domain-containing protein [Acidobacteriota bacterium]|nr:toll/interleukin-1 receptor domain-containing protein [Acidobacteriota bacterium]